MLFKISRLHIKIYLYFLGTTFAIFILISLWLSYSFEILRGNNQFILGLLLLFTLIAVITYPISLYITIPLGKLTRKTAKFSKKKAVETGEKEIEPGDEIEQLNKTFSVMADELLAMLEAKKELISYIAHELGTPLCRINVAVEIMEEQIEEGETPSGQMIKDISRNVKEMSHLLKELLELSRMDAKDYPLNKSPADLEQILDSVVDSFKIMTDKNNIMVKINKEGEFRKVFMDSEKMSRVIHNILSNAIKYSGENNEIEISLKRDNNYIVLSVKDGGPGILKENGERIFEPFFREDRSRARETGGTGLGLAIVQKIINYHNGNIRVENPGEKGAIITFKIPANSDE